MKMNQSEFNTIFNKTLLQIEEYLDQLHNTQDMDYDISNQMMTISFSKRNKIIISKQEPYQQLWLATKSNGYHFDYINKQWICNKSRQNFWKILEQSFNQHGNKIIDFSQFYCI